MNLISKEETINVLAARADEVGGIGKAYYERAIQIVAAMPLAETKQEVKEAEPEWIAADKNPRRKGLYLCFMQNSNDHGTWHEVCAYHGKGMWTTLLDEIDASKVVKYWRPLPKEP